MKTIKIEDLIVKLNEEKIQLIDVREKEEFEIEHINGSILVPLSNLINETDKIDKNNECYIICRTDRRSKAAAEILQTKGYDCIHVLGGVLAYMKVISSQTNKESFFD